MDKPFTDEQIRSWGFAAWRWMPEGELIACCPMMFGNGRLCRDVNMWGVGDGYCFDSLAQAIASMNEFDPATMEEPEGWKRHIQTGRRREGGDKSKEYINL